MGGMPPLSKGSHGDVCVVMVAHFLGNLGGCVKNLDGVLELVLEGLGIREDSLGGGEAVRGAEAGGDLLLGLAQTGIELLERGLVLCKVPHVPAVLVKLLVDVIVQGGHVVSELLQSLQELLGVAGDLLSLLGEHVHPLLLQGLALGGLLEQVLCNLQNLSTLLLWVRGQEGVLGRPNGFKFLLKIEAA